MPLPFPFGIVLIELNAGLRKIMRKASLKRTLLDFQMNMGWDIYLLTKIEKAKRIIGSLDEKRSVFEVFVFRICANWEILVEDLLIDCLNKDTSQYSEYTGFQIRRNMSRDECKAIIMGTGYLDFKGISDLKKNAKKILIPNYNPFKRIPHINGMKIDEFFSMRNYLAHYSDAAKRSLRNIYETQYGLHTFRQPGEFLLAKDKTDNISRMDVYIDNFIDTLDHIAKFLDIDIG